jgi:hypothetical protein
MANAGGRERIDVEVVRILRKLGLKPEALAILQHSEMPDNKNKQDRRDRRGRAWGVLSLGLSMLAWYYAVITPEPNFIYTSVLLGGFVAFISLALMELFMFNQRRTVYLVIVAVMAFGLAEMKSYKDQQHRVEQRVAAELAAQSKDTYRFLTASMDLVEGDDPIRSVFAYANGGNAPIIVTDICAFTRSLNLANNNFMPHARFCMFPSGEVHRLRDGADGQENLLFGRNIQAQIACADLTVTIQYRLENHPLAESKDFRFVSRFSARGMKWLKEDVEDKTDFCFDKAFQAPYGNMIISPPAKRQKK